MSYNVRCEICDVAWALGKSEQQFYDEYTKEEREQLMATYRSKINRSNVMAMFPMSPKKG